MAPWTPADLALLGRTDSLVLTAGDVGHPGVETGMVLVHGQLYVRAFRGVGSGWYRAAHEHGHGRIRVGTVTRDVLLRTDEAGPVAAIEAAYRAKYGSAASALVASTAARAATVRIDPAPPAGVSTQTLAGADRTS
ncbi:DUF2255 family protein [Streptomyces sp. cg35]|uniref:DUF2255 family protein n=1 Tax=Streptomyces sp. cg35 TaxID=3421650 RepID=UPI003D164F91